MLPPGHPSARSRIALLAGLLLAIAAPRPCDAALVFVQEEGREEVYTGITDVLVSPEGRHVYITDYTSSQFTVYSRDPDTGAIEELFETYPGVNNVVAFTMSGDGEYVYAIGYYASQIAVLRRDALTGQLTPIQTLDASAILYRSQGMTLSPDEAYLYITGIDTHSIAVYARDAVTGLLSFVDVYVNDTAGITGLRFPIGVAVSSDGKNVYVGGDHDPGSLVIFQRDPSTGKLTFVESLLGGVGGDLRYAFAVAVSPDGANVYVSVGLGGTVYRRDLTTGQLLPIQFVSGRIDHDVWITADGTRVYGCSAGGTLAGFARNPINGMLVEDERIQAGVDGFSAPAFCFGMTITPDGEYIYTIDTYDDDDGHGPEYEYAVGVFRRTHAECTPTPRVDCRGTLRPGVSTLGLFRGSFSQGDRLRWTWTGAATSLADLADPVNADKDYALCVYDQQGMLASAVAAGATPCTEKRQCWRDRGVSGYLYDAPGSGRRGFKMLKLIPGGDGKAKFLAVAKGPGFEVRDSALVGTATAQLQSGDGTSSLCWEATYSQPRENTPVRYRARSD